LTSAETNVQQPLNPALERFLSLPPTGPASNPEPYRAELCSFLRRLGAGAESDDVIQEAFVPLASSSRRAATPPRGCTTSR